MTDIFLYPGNATLYDIVLLDPTQASSPPTIITVGIATDNGSLLTILVVKNLLFGQATETELAQIIVKAVAIPTVIQMVMVLEAELVLMVYPPSPAKRTYSVNQENRVFVILPNPSLKEVAFEDRTMEIEND